MAFVLSDLTRDTTSTTGTGPVSLDNSALTLGQLLSDVLSDGDTTLYCIRHRTLNEWETGLGTYAANTLTRTTVFESSNAGSAVDFSVGIKDVIISAPALMTAMLDREQTFSEMQTFTAGASMDSQKITELATPTNPTDAATKQYVDDSTGGAVTSFNSRSGNVILTSTDVTNALSDPNIAYTDVENNFTEPQTFQAPDATHEAINVQTAAFPTAPVFNFKDSDGNVIATFDINFNNYLTITSKALFTGLILDAGTGSSYFGAGGNFFFRQADAEFIGRSDGLFGWTGILAVFGTGPDTALIRASAAVVKITDGTTGTGSLITAGLAANITTVTTTYAVAADDYTVLCDATAAAFTVTLPTAVGCQGRIYNIKKIDSSGNDVTIATTSGQTIDGATTKALSTQYANIQVQSDNANWWVTG